MLGMPSVIGETIAIRDRIRQKAFYGDSSSSTNQKIPTASGTGVIPLCDRAASAEGYSDARSFGARFKIHQSWVAFQDVELRPSALACLG